MQRTLNAPCSPYACAVGAATAQAFSNNNEQESLLRIAAEDTVKKLQGIDAEFDASDTENVGLWQELVATIRVMAVEKALADGKPLAEAMAVYPEDQARIIVECIALATALDNPKDEGLVNSSTPRDLLLGEWTLNAACHNASNLVRTCYIEGNNHAACVLTMLASDYWLHETTRLLFSGEHAMLYIIQHLIAKGRPVATGIVLPYEAGNAPVYVGELMTTIQDALRDPETCPAEYSFSSGN